MQISINIDETGKHAKPIGFSNDLWYCYCGQVTLKYLKYLLNIRYFNKDAFSKIHQKQEPYSRPAFWPNTAYFKDCCLIGCNSCYYVLNQGFWAHRVTAFVPPAPDGLLQALRPLRHHHGEGTAPTAGLFRGLGFNPTYEPQPNTWSASATV